ncbi:MAG: hypothetical protein JO261_01765 [Alphaproteobacteria bacterium]|nr:hypothetical protein [Alphaproteobacteria bacterium]MBV9692405.1 hypothetical protein [Alphaproteobacteria bacterium]
MSKPFTVIAGLLLLVVAAAHFYRIYAGWDIIAGGHSIPMMASWIGGTVTLVLGVMVLMESRR